MKLNTFLCGVLCLGALSACSEEMDYHEYNNYDEDFVKLNFGNVGGLITNIYSDLDTDFGSYSGAVLGAATDEAEYAYSGGAIETFYNGTWSPVNTPAGAWSSCYRAISNCNLYLERFTGLTFPELEMNADYKPQMYRYNNYRYEVRCLRAYYYFLLVRQYGDVPFSDHVLTADESNSLPRTPAQDIFDYIIAECDAVKDSIIADYANLPADVALPAESPETGRVNRLTVLALKARAALYAASPLFNPTGDKELWHRAALANKELLDAADAAKMKLIDDYAKLWTKNNYKDATSEIIFGRRADRESSSMETSNFPAGWRTARVATARRRTSWMPMRWWTGSLGTRARSTTPPTPVPTATRASPQPLPSTGRRAGPPGTKPRWRPSREEPTVNRSTGEPPRATT